MVTGWLQVCVLNTRDEREVQGKPEQNWEHMWSMVTSSTFQVQDGITVLPPSPSLFLYCVYKRWKKNARIHTYALLELIGTRAASKYCCSCVLFYHLIKMHRERESAWVCVCGDMSTVCVPGVHHAQCYTLFHPSSYVTQRLLFLPYIYILNPTLIRETHTHTNACKHM